MEFVGPPLKRSNSCPCIHAEETEEDVAARLAECTACLKNFQEIQAKKTQPHKSSMKAATSHESPEHTNGSENGSANGSVEPESTKKSLGVSFGHVELHEHQYMLGCHPDVKYGAPTTISWCPIHSEKTSVDNFEATHGPNRRPQSAFRMASTQRQETLFRAGYTLEDLERVTKEILEIQQSRKLSARESSELQRLINEARRKKQAKKMKRRGLRRFMSF